MTPLDPDLLAGLFDAHSRGLLLYARQWLDHDAAQDAVATVFARLAAQRRPPDSPRAWLYRALRNEAVAQLRTRRRHSGHHQALGHQRPGWFEPGLDDAIDAQAATAALAALPAEIREPVVLRIWGDLTVAEAAQVLGVPPSTLHWRYQNGLKLLRERMNHGQPGLV
jgi:RNA polymerase sigma-70 factor (ECF subfamily)